MKCVIVVDMQNDFITGPLGTPEAIVAKDNIEKYLKTLTRNDFVIFTRDTHFDDYLERREGRKLPVPHCIENTNGWQIDTELEKVALDMALRGRIIDKTTFGSIDNLIHAIDPRFHESFDEIIICGVCTDICVVSNALILKAAFPEAEISVLANCCAGITPEKHEAALSVMESCQINIVRE